MPTEFVGRDRELTSAIEMLDAAEEGHGGVLAVEGDAGIGKSRLAREIARRARGRGMAVVWTVGWPDGDAGPYWPWPEVLAGIEPNAADLLDVESDDADNQRFERFRATRQVLRDRAATRPLVVVVDDAHLVDADGLLLTRFIARGVVGHRILLVIAHGPPVDIAPSAAALLGEIGVEGRTIRLSGMREDEVRDLVSARGEDANSAVVRRVLDQTDGNPFLVLQVLASGLHHRDVPLPEPVRRLLGGRLDALDVGVRNVLEAAAVLGRASSLSDLLLVAGVDPSTLEWARGAAAAAGIVRPDRSSTIEFAHDLAREAVLSGLAAPRRAALHEACLGVLETDADSPDRAVLRAHHALALVRAGALPAVAGLDLARTSARVLIAHHSPEAAVELLTETRAACETIPADAAAGLLNDLGEAMLATGRLADARSVFGLASTAADRAGDDVAYARAALGLGGVWVHEHRCAADRREYQDTIERAIGRIASEPSPSAVRLTLALRLRGTAERTITGAGAREEIRTALAAVQTGCEPREIAAGLSLLHHTMLGPADASARLEVAGELLDVARSVGDELHIVIGMLWRTVDLFLLGRDAARELRELRLRSDALGMRAILFVTDAIEVMCLLRAGELAGAERATAVCWQRGIDVGDPDAATYHAAHVLARSWYVGHAVDLLDLAEQVAMSDEMPAENPVFTAVVAALAAEAGKRDRAEQALSRLGRGRLHELLRGSCWLLTMFALVETAVALDDAVLADEVYELLRPHAALPMLGSLAMCCFGSTERSLGLAARVAGRLDDAVAHLERAEEENQRLGNWPLTAITRGELAATLHRRDAPGDGARASTLVAKSIDAAETLGLDGRLAGLVRLRDAIDHAGPEPSNASCVRLGRTWEITAGDERAEVPATIGMAYLAMLLAAPGVEISVGSLAGIDIVSPPQDVFDADALHALRRRIRELADAIDDADRLGRRRDSERLHRELDEITGHLRVAVGPGGKSRWFDDATERARTSVQKAIRRAIQNIGRDAPRLARTFERSISTGYRCAYEPIDTAPLRWVVEAHVSPREEPQLV